MTSTFPTPGEVFEDTYRIEAILGSGGFARVYRAVEIGLERPVALKILRPPTNSAQSDSQRDNYMDTLMERFQREAMMLSKLRSSYTVNLYKYGKTEEGLLYMALEYIDGLSLQEILRAGKPLRPSRVAKILRQVLVSLQEAHALGMLHRDLKPANIMVYEHLGEEDQVKLLDFGIAKLVTESGTDNQEDLTSDGTLIGTPRYMAPEQIQGSSVGPPSDIYALGLVGYELLTGERAIKGDSSIQIIGKQLAPQSFKLPNIDKIPPGLRYVINKMMEKDLDFRYVDCEAVLVDLARPSVLKSDEELSNDDIPQIEIDGPIEMIEDIDFEDEPSLDQLPPASTSRENLFDITRDEPFETTRKVIIALIIVALLGTVGIIWTVIQGGEEPEQPDLDPIAGTKPIEPENAERPEVETAPEIQVTAKLDGTDIDGVTVLVNGVEKGFTPLTLRADEIRNAKVVARYKMPDRDDTVENAQEVTDPRDLLFEFDAVVSELIRPEPEPVVKPDDEPRPTPGPRTPRPRPKPKPIQNLYPAPE